MALPDGARFEAEIALGVALWDVTATMPQGGHRRKTRRPKGAAISGVYVHHSGSLGADGVEGAIRSAEYVVSKRDFPGGQGPYHLWLPYHPLRDDEGRMVLLRMSRDEQRTWSQGAKANDHGWSMCLQGNLTKAPISAFQVELLEAAIPWALARFGLPIAALRMHAEAGDHGGRSKATCPGESARAWLKAYRRSAAASAA